MAKYIEIDEIYVPGDTGFPVSERVVQKLMESIKREGLISPIVLVEVMPARISDTSEDQANYLVAGRHRLEATKRLGLTKIRFEYTDKRSNPKLISVDENLVRRQFEPGQLGMMTTQRENIIRSAAAVAGWKAGKGGNRGNHHTKNSTKDTTVSLVKTPTETMAEELGVAEVTIKKRLATEAKIAEAFDAETAAIVRADPKLYSRRKVEAYHDKFVQGGKDAALAELERVRTEVTATPKPAPAKSPRAVAAPVEPKPAKVRTLTLAEMKTRTVQAILRAMSEAEKELCPLGVATDLRGFDDWADDLRQTIASAQ